MNQYSVALLVCLGVIVVLHRFSLLPAVAISLHSRTSENSAESCARSWHTPKTPISPSASSVGFFTTPISVSALLQKGSKNAPRKPNKINGRISPIRPFHKLYL